MTYNTIISAQELQQLMQSGAPLCVVDTSFDLGQPELGQQQFVQSHIPSAIYAHLDAHLSSCNTATQLNKGRHPLPTREEFAQVLQQLGIQNNMQVVVYDRNGCNYCGRLWWMLQWLGHEAVAVLDGGLAAWQAAGYATASGDVTPTPASVPFALHAPLVDYLSLEQVLQQQNQGKITLIDSRGAPRYRGEVEPLDPVAGHIPGALNRLFSDNLASNGLFKSAETLRAEFEQLLANQPAEHQVAVYCGSGVSAVPNVLAMRMAGLPTPALYAGSWSEYSRAQPPLPYEKG